MSVFRVTAAHGVAHKKPVEIGKYSPPTLMFAIPVGVIFMVMTYYFTL